MKNIPLGKGIALVVLVLFIGMSIIPSTIGVDKSSMPTFTDPTIVSIQPSTQAVEPGETFDVSVYIEPGEPIIGIEIYLYFDETLIQANSVTFEGFFDPYPTYPSIPVIDNVNGSIYNVFEILLGPGNVNTSGSWVTISFTAQQELGTSPLDLEGVIIADAVGGTAPVTVNDGEVTVTPNPCTLTIIIIGIGTTDPPPGVHSYLCGTPITLFAFPDICWEFVEWSIDGSSSINNPEFFTLINDTVVTATFTEISYDLTMSKVGSGTTTPALGVHTYACGTVVPLTATPAAGWSFVNWSGDVATTDNPTSVTIDNNKFIRANFNFTNPPEIEDITLTHSIPKDTSLPGNPACFSGGWENITCTVTDDGTLDVVQINFTYTYTYWGPWKDYTEYFTFPMSNIGDTYYYNTTLTGPGEYTYHIWANDTNGNHNSTLPETFFLPMNEDVDGGGKVHFMDLIAVSMAYNQVGPCGFIRADVNNDGKVHFMDFVAISMAYNQIW